MKLLCGLLIFSLAISSAFSLECYLCEGSNGTTCAEPNDVSDLKGMACPKNRTGVEVEVECITFVYKLDNGSLNTARGCSPKGFCENQDIPFFEIVSCESCTDDLCNNSYQLNANAMIISLLVLPVSAFLSKLFK